MGRGESCIPVQRLPLEGFIALCLLCSFSFQCFMFIRLFFFNPFLTEGQKPDFWCHRGLCHTSDNEDSTSAFCWLECQSPELQRSLGMTVVMESPRPWDHSNCLDLLWDRAASVYISTAQLTQYVADTVLHNGQRDEHHVNAWAILSAILGSCMHRSTQLIMRRAHLLCTSLNTHLNIWLLR